MVGVRSNSRSGIDVKHLHCLVNGTSTNDKTAKKTRKELRRQGWGRKYLVHLSRVRVKLQHRRALLIIPYLPSIAMIRTYSDHAVLSSRNECTTVHCPRHTINLSLRWHSLQWPTSCPERIWRGLRVGSKLTFTIWLVLSTRVSISSSRHKDSSTMAIRNLQDRQYTVQRKWLRVIKLLLPFVDGNRVDFLHSRKSLDIVHVEAGKDSRYE